MKLEIFTEEQANYFYDNYEKLQQLERSKRNIQDSDEDYERRSRKMHSIMDQEDNIRRNLEPFVSRNKEYEKRLGKVYEAHGLSKDDFPDDMTVIDIVKLQKTMKEESSEFTYDLQRKRNKELEAMFKGNDKTQDLSELNAMFKDNNSKKEENGFEKQFK